MELKLINADDLKSLIYPLIQKAIAEELATKSRTQPEDLISFKQAHALLGLAPSTLYNLVSQRRIPNSKKGKRLYFSRKELFAWVESGKREAAELKF
jgi:excisionase family DNA binding protein